MTLYEITKEEAYHVFRTGGTVYGSSVGMDTKHAFVKDSETGAPICWITEHTRLQTQGLKPPVLYWTD